MASIILHALTKTKFPAFSPTRAPFFQLVKLYSQSLASRTPDLRIFLAEKMRMGVFGQERGEISAFLYGKKCGENVDGSIWTGMRINLRIISAFQS